MSEAVLAQGTRGLVAAGCTLLLAWIALAFALQAENRFARALVVLPLLVVTSSVSLACWVAGNTLRKTANCCKKKTTPTQGEGRPVAPTVYA